MYNVYMIVSFALIVNIFPFCVKSVAHEVLGMQYMYHISSSIIGCVPYWRNVEHCEVSYESIIHVHFPCSHLLYIQYIEC